MILAHRDRHQAIFDLGEGRYVSVAVEAWSDEGEPMCLGREGKLVSVIGHPMLVRIIPAIPQGNGADREAWFRRALGLDVADPIHRTGPWSGPQRANLTTARPFLPEVTHHVPEAE